MSPLGMPGKHLGNQLEPQYGTTTQTVRNVDELGILGHIIYIYIYGGGGGEEKLRICETSLYISETSSP